jgi:hypothetical protein
MTRAKATALIEELTLLCIIFPCEKIASDEPDNFPDLSTMFRFFVFKLFMLSVVVLISCYSAKQIFSNASLSIATLKIGDENVPTAAFTKRHCFSRLSSPLYQSASPGATPAHLKPHPLVLQLPCRTLFGPGSCIP